MDSKAKNASPAALPLVHSCTLDGLILFAEKAGEPAYRARQVWHWLYVKKVSDWPAMRNVPASFRNALAESFSLESALTLRTDGEPGGTRKVLVGLRDGERVEEVLIPAERRRTVCVSTQVGCRFRCAFCASGQAGFVRNLEAGEIVGQVLLAGREFGDRPSHVVLMGVGEPLDNYDATLKAVRIMNDQDGLCIGARRITISTCGVIPGIRQLAQEGLQVELSVSLHAPSDDLRSRLVPANRKYPLADLLVACREYFDQTGRIITFEYTLIQGVNDQASHAQELVRLLTPLACRVNLIPLSPVAEYEGTPSPEAAADLFVRTLDKAGINATVRASRGTTVNAACGQLRSRHAGKV